MKKGQISLVRNQSSRKKTKINFIYFTVFIMTKYKQKLWYLNQKLFFTDTGATLLLSSLVGAESRRKQWGLVRHFSSRRR